MPQRTWVGRLTGEGRGAIAVIRIWGARAIEVADAVFRPNRGLRLAETPPGRLRLGRIGEGPGDEVVAVVLKSETPAVEVQCHGGEAAVALVVAALEAAGAERCGQLDLAACLSGDSLAATALDLLARAPTVLTAEILLDQWQGALGRELARINQSIARQPEEALAGLDALIERAAVGLRLLSGWRIVIAGRPNVGKSRLFNALAGFARAIVDPTPGTTRDVVTFKSSIGGWSVEIADTAGLRETLDPIEKLGITRSRIERDEADMVLMVLDRSKPLEPIDRELIGTAPGAIVVANKSDLPAAWDDRADWLRSYPVVTVSAERGDGVLELIQTIAGRLVAKPPPAGAGVPFRPGQLVALREIRASLAGGDVAAAAQRLDALGEQPVQEG
jgi:tRNA modification GTPase